MTVKNLIFSEHASDAPTGRKPDIGVHLHAFYPDLIPTFVERLSFISTPFTLYVSVPEGVNADEAVLKEKLSRIPQAEDVCIRRTPNRGRDIAPMLCTFADELMSHDIILHLHTKKSPQNVIQTGWLTFILDYLLASPANVSTILNCLQQDGGMISPPNFLYRATPDGWGVPENIVLAQEIVDRSRLNINLERDYPTIDFPQGSMFWARKEFLLPLFDLKLTYEDFPEEPIGLDGTVAHALERLFFLWGNGTKYNVYRVFHNNSDVTLQSRFFTMTQLLSRERTYFIRKNQKHLLLLRITLTLCALLTAIIVYLLFFSNNSVI
jgi:lipopolysaccharide biosynthesis protein